MNASIIIPCYNMGDFVEEALSSALATTGLAFEVIVLDDGSSDPHTQTVLAKLEQQYAATPNVHFHRHNNMGLSATRNRGISLATGTLILPLDADNRIHAEFLIKAKAQFDQDETLGVVYSWAKTFGSGSSGVREFPEFDLQRMLLGNTVEACSVFRRKVWQDVGGYDETKFKEGYEDWDFWLGAVEHGWKFKRIPEALFEYRVRPDSMVSTCNEPAIRQKLVTQLIEKHKDLYASCWPELLIQRELTTLAYEKAVAGYHQRFVEALADFQHFATEWNQRCEQLEAKVQAQNAQLHQLRYVIGIFRRLERAAALFRRKPS